MKIFHSDNFIPTLPSTHRFPIVKYRLIREQLMYEGSFLENEMEESLPISEHAILRVHHVRYWQAMRDLQLSSREVRKMGFPQSKSLVERSRRSVGGTLQAALWSLDHGIGLNIAGGTHHAYPDRAEGFCLLNDFAITATHLLAERLLKRILIVDLDVHQGNANALIFQDEPRVFTFSMHGKDNYPLHKEKSDLDLPLANGTGDGVYLSHLTSILPRLLSRHSPDLVLYQAGVDPLETDTLGKLALSQQGCKTRDRFVLETCAQAGIPVTVAIGGGYSQRLRDTVEAHANTFRVARHVFG